MRNDCSNKLIKDTPIGKALVCLQKEQHHKLKGLFNTAYTIAKNCRPFRSECCVLCKIGFIKITPPILKRIANQMSCLFVYYSLIMQNSFCQTFTICDMGQLLHPAGQVTFTCHYPRDKFCKKYISDPVLGWESVKPSNRIWPRRKPCSSCHQQWVMHMTSWETKSPVQVCGVDFQVVGGLI